MSIMIYLEKRMRNRQVRKVCQAKVRNWFEEYRKNQSCIICKENHPAVLDFHHIDPNTKFKDVPNIAAKGTFKQLQIEINKCIVLCSNCHRKLHNTDTGTIKSILSKIANLTNIEQISFISELN